MIQNRTAVESSINMLLERFEHAKCDSDGVSSCVRCNVVFLAKSAKEALSAVAEVAPNYEKLFKEWVSIQAGDVQKMIADAMRYQAVKGCDWIGLRVDDQEFIGVSNLDAWADVRLSGPNGT